MSLENTSKELKELIARFDTEWLLGDLSSLIHAGKEKANDQLGNLSSPMRQLYYLAGLNMSSDPENGNEINYSHEIWNRIVVLLNKIEVEYDNLFFPNKT